jgi:hypothetical protein
VDVVFDASAENMSSAFAKAVSFGADRSCSMVHCEASKRPTRYCGQLPKFNLRANTLYNYRGLTSAGLAIN